MSDPTVHPASLVPVSGRVAMLPPNAPGPRRGWLVAIVAVVVVVAAIAALPRLSNSGETGSLSVPAEAFASAATLTPGLETPSPLPTPPSPTVAPAPAWTIDLVGQLDCEGPPASIGADTGEVHDEGSSPDSPEAAIGVFVETTMYTSLPITGYELTDRDEHWVRFAHRVDGLTKAVVVIWDAGPEFDPGIWSVAGLRACDPAEFAPGSGFTGSTLAVWLDAEDERVPTTYIHETRGPEHCSWESTNWLHLDGLVYIRDPNGVLKWDTVGPFNPDAELPNEAKSTGYHEGDRTIWRDGDPDSVYVVSSGRVERWPRATDQLGCM